MTQQIIFRNAVGKRRLERIYVIETFAGEVPYTEEILVDIGNRGSVRIYSGVTGKNAGKPRTRSTLERDADTRL